MDKIFFNGRIRTLDDAGHVAEAVGVENGKIVFVGTNEEAEKIACEEKVDLGDRLLLPGFVDTHLHMLHYAFVERSVKLFDCTSVEEMLDAAKKRIEEHAGKPLTWLYCRGWNEEHFAEPTALPNRLFIMPILRSRDIRTRMSWMPCPKKSRSSWSESVDM